MSIKSLVQPKFASLLTSDSLLEWRRRRSERRRRKSGDSHTVTWFHRADDPYSYLLAQALSKLQNQYRIDLVCKVVSPTPDNMMPHPGLWLRYGMADCSAVAAHYGLEFPVVAESPSKAAVDIAHGRLHSASNTEQFIERVVEDGLSLWAGNAPEPSHSPPADGRMEAAREELRSLGHYGTGMLHYGGEWYWGIDRLPFLERRLEGLGLGSGSAIQRVPAPCERRVGSQIEFYFSFRSPYSYLAAERIAELSTQLGVELLLKPVLPMVMRGLPVPRSKRMYIVLDAKRAATDNGLPFGRICDPVGSGVERTIAVFLRAEDKAVPFLLSAMRGIWSEGIDVASDRGLRLVAERAGISWDLARRALTDQRWREVAANNREALLGHGLWGVPTFVSGDFKAWGQDRLWLLKRAFETAQGGE